MAGDGGGRLEVEAVERVGAQVGEEDVRRREQLFQPFPRLGLAQVEDDAALAPVVLREGGVREVLADAQGAEGTAHGVTVGRLHLDDIRAPVGQQGAGGRCGHPDTHLDDAQPTEGGETGRFVRFIRFIRFVPFVPFVLVVDLVGHGASRPGERAAWSRSTSLSTFPVALSGSASTISTTRGTL